VSRLRAVVGFAVLLVAGCTAPRIVPVPAAGVEIDVYLRLRAATRTFSLQFHHRLGEMPRVLTLSFAVERDETTSPGA
jgi:hypothetical protein